MSTSPVWKVYDPDGTYQAATKEPEAALVVAALYGDGATIKRDHRLEVWRQGVDSLSAYDNYEDAVALINLRVLVAHKRSGK